VVDALLEHDLLLVALVAVLTIHDLQPGMGLALFMIAVVGSRSQVRRRSVQERSSLLVGQECERVLVGPEVGAPVEPLDDCGP